MIRNAVKFVEDFVGRLSCYSEVGQSLRLSRTNVRVGMRLSRRLRPTYSASALLIVGLLLNLAGIIDASTALADASPSADRELTQVYEFKPPIIQSLGARARVSIPGCSALQIIGEPSLPFITAKILLPPNSSIRTVEATAESEPELLDGSWVVEWGLTPVPSPGNASAALEPAEDLPNAATYQSDLPYPAERAQIASVQRMAGYDLALLRLFPVQYRPASGRLFFAKKLRLTIHLTTQSAGSPKLTSSAPAHGRVADFADNPELLSEYVPFIRRPFEKTSAIKYLLITKQSIVSAFQPLLNAKMLEGVAVHTQTVEFISANIPGQDLPEKIRMYIRQAYTNEGIEYVLLGGDSSIIPPRYAYVPMPGTGLSSYLVPTDLYYACLDGSWNGNGNSNWGESTDGEDGGDVDLLAEVYVGRAPVDTPEEASVFVDKTLRYQAEGGGYAETALLAASYLGYYDPPGSPPPVHAQGGDILDPLLPSLESFAVTWLDDRPHTTAQWSAADAVRELNRSPALAVYGGHGDADTVMRLYAGNLSSLTNQDLFFAYSVSCAAGEFDNYSFWPDCIGEELVKKPSAGAFAAVFNSRVGWFDPEQEWRFSGEFQNVFFEELQLHDNTRLAKANQASKELLVGQVESSGVMTYRWCYYEITLFGDPHTAIQSHASPVDLEVFSMYGDASPPNGTYAYAPGSMVTCRLSSAHAPGTTGVQYVYSGWTAQGSVPAAGDALEVSFVISNDSSIVWNWTTQYLLSATASTYGWVECPNGWYASGPQQVEVRAVASNYCRFVAWQGDVPAGSASNPIIAVVMDQPRSLIAHFAENQTSHGVPQWWLAQYGWTNDWELVEQSDTDADGCCAWQEYVAGTCPTDSVSFFEVEVSRVGPACALEWSSVSNRLYSVACSENLVTGFVEVTNRLPATPPQNVFVDVNGNPSKFYRIQVEPTP
jgi:hypothetical protein